MSINVHGLDAGNTTASIVHRETLHGETVFEQALVLSDGDTAVLIEGTLPQLRELLHRIGYAIHQTEQPQPSTTK